jgi:hypothetical protein
VPQPPQVDAVARQLIDRFTAAQRNIEAQLATITEGRRAARLRQLQRTVNALLDDLEAQMRGWIEHRLPSIYQFGAGNAAAALGDSFVWTQPHLEAMQVLATRSWDDLLGATRYVRRDVKDWVRDEARQQVTLSLVEGRTATQAAQALARAAGNELGVFTVTYKDGSRHRMSDYADSAVRAVSAETYNTGTTNQARDLGVRFMECADGFDCGLAAHDDQEKPNGRLYPIDVAASYPIAHPRCRRSWIPRADATSASAGSLRTPASLGDQRAFEQQQQARNIAPGGRGPRTPRTPRSGSARTARATRAPAKPATRGVSPRTAISVKPGPRAKVGPGIDRGLTAIEKVHRVPEGIAPVPVKSSSARTFYGRYTYTVPGGAPGSIAIADHGDHIGSTMTHEFGHYLDSQILGPQPGRWGTSFIADNEALLEWGRAIDASPTMQALRQHAVDHPHETLARYYLSKKEIWARSYAQWIATRAGDDVLLAEMAAIRTDVGSRALSQWEPDEFGAIASTFDRIFADLGLLA